MKLPRNLSGERLVRVLCRHYGYRQIHQEGSHIILQAESPTHHRLAVPNHDPLRLCMLNAILRAVAQAQQIEKEEILRHL
jgi:predicted RNA binding protein YcfA (HicA-like mRNA interferase family)